MSMRKKYEEILKVRNALETLKRHGYMSECEYNEKLEELTDALVSLIEEVLENEY